MNDTITALATANAQGAINIVRMSGSKALQIALKLCKKKELVPRYAHLCKIYASDESLIDECIVIYFKAPFSFTGEDIVEFQTHGGYILASLMLEELQKQGVRLANAGEFSKRAYLNGKMNLLKASNIASLINAKSQSQAKLIARNLEGKLGEFLEKIRLDLVKTLAFVETSIDYADDDLPSDLFMQIQNMCEQNAKDLKKIAEISLSKKALLQGYKIAIIGKPNVGKSSLLNAFLNYERAIVSNEAGTTRDTIEENLQIGSHLLKIIDTAGIRKGLDEIEKKGIELSKKAIDEADIIIALFDGSRKKDKEDEELISLIKEKGKDKKIFWLLNKSDLRQEFKEEGDFLKLSVQKDISKLLKALKAYLDTNESVDFILPNLELVHAFIRASEAIFRARDLLSEQNLELFAFELNLALKELEKFTHSFEQDELMDAIFSSFCLGK
ncbi:tRNA uridine-5-carboxymethylaminomethyl(34) synthesis GTPase MnmE [Campylobacter sp. MIT 99-7217]|uniref:tRNA uridine-5-carboxymethylaminomethyl(34) synthesis GTPase MnmE n=1 Tax=Campylobacter sp. MIT 99-7217 TaxID=535091 RepID=UPI00115C1EC5|nr:tRNA uridine-5-carboxymethylaminomethyl(34) synthesis GTPase MnmE [Campylobacter sp. MIT 99-7217]TQR34749.1 tRNA uridine-5-carboxymethylaminomethyl(34) synthesis GTPase MnmE [Campylobacter sp. MIT 99-7217]